MKRDYPLNLSILIRGGKETNKDSPSNGEWSGKSSSWKSECLTTFSNCSLKMCVSMFREYKSLETGHQRGWEFRIELYSPKLRTTSIQRVELFEIAALSGWYVSSKAKYWWETDSEQVPWGKDEKNFEKRVKKYLKLLKGKRWKSVPDWGVMSCVYWSWWPMFLQKAWCCWWRINVWFLIFLWVRISLICARKPWGR